MNFENVEARLKSMPARTGFFYRNLLTGETKTAGADEEMFAASIIKLFILADTMQQIEEGKLDRNQLITVHREDCVPPSGVLTFLHNGVQVTVQDLFTLMTVVSDNTATNLLIDILGMEQINDFIRSLGFEKTTLRRKMYDTEKSACGIQNTITAREVGELLTRMYRGELVSPAASAEMLEVLKNQQVNHKIPFYLSALPDCPDIAHKTGEDDGITHDCGIVFTKEPFAICFTCNDADVPACERMMAELSLEIVQTV